MSLPNILEMLQNEQGLVEVDIDRMVALNILMSDQRFHI